MKKYIVAVVVIMTGAISSLPAYAADGIKTMDVAKQEIQLVVAAVEAPLSSLVGSLDGFFRELVGSIDALADQKKSEG